MPSMEWERFQDAHYRPHLVIANLAEGIGPVSGDLFQSLAATLGVSGNYAIRGDGTIIQAVFEIDKDAERFASALSARASFRDLEWASKTVANVDRAAQKRIAATLRRSGSRPAPKR
jgi:hypothetical protein